MPTNRGKVKVYAGTDGVPTIEIGAGLPGAVGPTGPTGATGATGPTGATGRSVTGASIDGSGHLILTFSSAPSPVDVGDVTGNDGRSVTGASIDGSGHLILTFSSAPSPVDVGDVTGADGTNGADGRSITGASIDGSGHLILTFSSAPSPVDVGDVTGNDGRSVTGASIDGSGHLILTFSSAPSPVDVGDVTGADGTNGADGRSITGASIDGSGHLILTFSSAPTTVDVGDVTGTDGTDGTDGADGVSIVGASIDGSYHLILDMSSGPDIDAGYVRGPAGTGDVTGPGTSVSGNFASYADATGSLLADSGKSSASFATAAQGTLADNSIQGPGAVTTGRFVTFSGTTGKAVADSGFTSASFATAAQGTTADGAIQGPGAVTSGNLVTFSGTTGKVVAELSFASLWALTKTLTNTTFNAAGTGNALSNISTSMFASGVLDTDGTLAANSDTKIASQKATKTYVDALIAAADAMVFKGVIDCSTNLNYPAADRGWTYRVSVAGKIGGASGTNVEAGDILLCLNDSTASGDQATVGANWSIIQTNLDGAVIGPSSVTDGNLAAFDGTTGKLIKQLTASQVRSALSLVVGTNVQAWDADLDTWAGKTAPSGTVVGTTDTQTMSGKTIDGVTLRDAITVESSANNSSTNFAIDLANGTVQVITLTGNWVPSTGWPTATAGQGFRLIVKQDGTGSRTITWPSSVKWPASTAPTITATASKADIFDFESDGTNWFGVVAGQAYL